MPAEGMKFPLVFTFTMLEIEDLNARIALFNTKAERKISRARYIARILGLGKNPPSPANHD